MSTTESVTFYGTLALSRDVFWMKQETNSLGLAALENEKPVTNGPTSDPTDDPTTSYSTSNPTSVSKQERYSHFEKRKGCHIMNV